MKIYILIVATFLFDGAVSSWGEDDAVQAVSLSRHYDLVLELSELFDYQGKRGDLDLLSGKINDDYGGRTLSSLDLHSFLSVDHADRVAIKKNGNKLELKFTNYFEFEEYTSHTSIIIVFVIGDDSKIERAIVIVSGI